MPWRRTRDPYAIWISEAMLQQTRVETVIPYYERFLARFPDVASLALARDEEVLALWSGLGYYSRARALAAAARAIVGQHGGRFPRTRAGWLALPGVGPYTAGAVLSIAFSEREPLVDGNVERVFARLFGLEAPQGSAALRERCWELARELVPEQGLDPGDLNQALMELGARVCAPRAPACPSCPLRPRCAAHALGRVEELPRPRARPSVLEVELEILLPLRGERFLVEQRPSTCRMAGLLEFPTRELVGQRGTSLLWPREFRLALARGQALGAVRHTITRHRITAEVALATVPPGLSLPEGAGWSEPGALGELALTGLARKAWRLWQGVRTAHSAHPR